MKKVEAIMQEDKLEELKQELNNDFQVAGMTVVQVLGCGRQKGSKVLDEISVELTTLLPKVNVSFIVEDQDVEAVIALIIKICRTEEIGDGKIFVYPIEEVIRIRTGERGLKAI